MIKVRWRELFFLTQPSVVLEGYRLHSSELKRFVLRQFT